MVRVVVRVVDAATDRPLPYVFCSLDGVGAATDSAGVVVLSVPPKSYWLEARTTMYSPYSARIDATRDTSIVVRLHRAVF